MNLERIGKNPVHYTRVSEAWHDIVGMLIGLIATGVALLIDKVLDPPIAIIVNIGILYMARLGIVGIYTGMIRLLWWKGWTTDTVDEYTLATDHRFINAWTTAAATCLAAITLLLFHDDTPGWATQWWVLVSGACMIGAMTTRSVLFFTPMNIYISIFRRYPEKNTNGEGQVSKSRNN